MNNLTEGGTLEGETRGETILHWMVECPETDRLAEADISARAAPFATFCSPRLMVKNCSFWPERNGCEQKCLKSQT